MKAKQLRPLLLLTIVPCLTFAGEIKTAFEGVKDYTDFSVSGLSEEKTLSIFKAELEDRLKSMGEKYLGKDQTLSITFTDIDMAGDIQPWRNSTNADIRYVEAVYPPRLKFDYVLAGANGAILSEGKESLSDLAFQMNSSAVIRGRYENFFYEADLLNGWIRKISKEGNSIPEKN